MRSFTFVWGVLIYFLAWVKMIYFWLDLICITFALISFISSVFSDFSDFFSSCFSSLSRSCSISSSCKTLCFLCKIWTSLYSSSWLSFYFKIINIEFKNPLYYLFIRKHVEDLFNGSLFDWILRDIQRNFLLKNRLCSI